MNVCTYGYSFAFVPWSYWQKHIDWMAMNGINMPLMFVGQEAIWVETFKQFNISLAEASSFYSGPAFLPWFRMGNMKGPERKNGKPTRLLLSLRAWGASSKADARSKAKSISARNKRKA